VAGAGRLGSSVAGDSALDGSLNDLTIINHSSKTIFALGFDENNTAIRTSFSNSLGSDVSCESASTCPAITSGYTGEGL